MRFPSLGKCGGKWHTVAMQTYFFAIALVSAFFLAGCQAATPTPTEAPAAAEQKSGFTTITGTVKASSKSSAMIQTSSGTIAVETYAVDFTQYDGQTVTATGKYSGDTLFISEIQSAQ